MNVLSPGLTPLEEVKKIPGLEFLKGISEGRFPPPPIARRPIQRRQQHLSERDHPPDQHQKPRTTGGLRRPILRAGFLNERSFACVGRHTGSIR